MPWLPLAPVLSWGSLRKCWAESDQSLGLTVDPSQRLWSTSGRCVEVSGASWPRSMVFLEREGEA